jgi:hypothetical protein
MPGKYFQEFREGDPMRTTIEILKPKACTLVVGRSMAYEVQDIGPISKSSLEAGESHRFGENRFGNTLQTVLGALDMNGPEDRGEILRADNHD